MGSDVFLLIFDPRRGAMVRSRWLGMTTLRRVIQRDLGRPTVTPRTGCECWSNVSPASLIKILDEISYSDGATSDEIRALAATFPASAYWWMLEDDF